MLLTSSLLQQVCNNFMVIEVWNRIGPQDQGDKVNKLLQIMIEITIGNNNFLSSLF